MPGPLVMWTDEFEEPINAVCHTYIHDKAEAHLAGTVEADEPQQKNAMEVELIQAPQDGSADTIVNLVLAPSYITYHAATVERLLGFFHTEQVPCPPSGRQAYLHCCHEHLNHRLLGMQREPHQCQRHRC